MWQENEDTSLPQIDMSRIPIASENEKKNKHHPPLKRLRQLSGSPSPIAKTKKKDGVLQTDSECIVEWIKTLKFTWNRHRNL